MKTHTIPSNLVSIETLMLILTSMSNKFVVIRARERNKPVYFISSTRTNWLKAKLDAEFLNNHTGYRFAARFDTDTVSALSEFLESLN